MKKYYYMGIICAIAILLIGVYAERDQRIFSIEANEVVSMDIYNASGPTSTDLDVQVMHVNDQREIADAADKLREIKPNDSAIPLDGNYTIIFHKSDGSKLTYAYLNGVVKTSAGFAGRVKSDNIINRLWANLNAPVQNITGEERLALS
ncbi:hypothetical protein GZH47_17295 [Paenibacillus rhizovicinus]|uniref:Uncharacterized protein n=1 Tax=Paenibacillus rhizovicinus TaxID=2704463 RepID=A0A6C0P209_9BACL|nr:hypothetical protein [Paenibacillus rhizovicinus]QHW32391.1 hypothetical protein GZH47_17295 [Paenibacillus rhizovicinus]